jgi:hypothetical protein
VAARVGLLLLGISINIFRAIPNHHSQVAAKSGLTLA